LQTALIALAVLVAWGFANGIGWRSLPRYGGLAAARRMPVEIKFAQPAA
jgi:hypothetical protein